MIPLVPFLTRCLVLVAAFLTVSVTAQTPLAITDFRVDLAGRAVVRVPSEAGFYFILYRGDEITAIQAATDVESLPSAGDPPSVELIDARPPTPLPSRFYRVERVPLGAPKDADRDGIDDVFELNSRPLLDPLNPADAALDPDNDGRSTLEEYRAGSNPFVASPPPAPVSPRLSPPASSTTGGRLELTGFGTANTYIRVEGGAALATNRVGADGAFMVSVPLSTNRINRLFVTAVNPQGNTSPGVPIEILQDSQPPTLHVDFPTNRMTFTTGNTLVAGRVGDSLSGYAGLSVWVHAAPAEGNPPLASTSFPPNSPYQATVDVGIGPNGTYERADVPLVEGTNIVSVVAMDALGNRTVRRAEVIRRPLVGPRLVMRSGDRQMTNVLRRLEQPLAVRAENPDGSPIPNVLLTMDVTRSDGRLLPANTNALASDWTLQPNATTNGAMVIQVRTDANGEAAAWWTLGSEAGCANNRVCVTSGTLDACVYFCASAMGNPGRQINIGSGNHQKVETGGATVEPLRAWVSDGLNPAAGVPVTFRVVEGNGRLVEGGRDGLALASTSSRPAGAGTEGSSLTVATGRTGHASVGFIAGSDAGQNVIEASFPGQFGLPATFIVYGVARDLTQPASFTGLILDNTSCPIGNAYCELEVAHYKVGTFSDGQGRFRFENVPGGMGHLHVNGRTATSVFTNTIPTNSFPALHYSVTTVPNAENSLPSPVLLPRLNPTNAHVYDGTKDLVLTCEGIDGLKMTIRANSMRDPQGNPVTPANPMVVSLDQVHHDDVPMPMPDGVAPAFAWTLQPGGATFDPPVTIEYPNMSGLPPGSIAYFLSFNHDTERFEIVSSGHITNDGSTIVTDPGSGLTLAGWGCNCPPYAVAGECAFPNPKECEGSFECGVEIYVDANSDGRISLTPLDTTTAASPVEFWTNDDNDSDPEEDFGDALDGPPDNGDSEIKSIRDLEDLLPIQIRFCPKMAELLRCGGELRLKVENVDLRFFRARVNGLGHLESQAVADQQIASSYSTYSGKQSYNRAIDPEDLTPHILESDLDRGYIQLLVEGLRPTAIGAMGERVPGTVSVEISKGGSVVATGSPFYIALYPVNEMFETIVTTGYPSDVDKPDTILSSKLPAVPTTQADGSFARLGRIRSQHTVDNTIVFVHGYNMKELEKASFAQTMFKRLWWEGYRGKFIALRWPCLFDQSDTIPSTTVFNDSEFIALNYATSLKSLLSIERGRIHVFAHSLGNMLTSEAFRQGAHATTYIMMQAAVGASAYDGMAPPDDSKVANLSLGEIDDPTFDGGLGAQAPDSGYRNFFAGIGLQARIVNFFNPQDYALEDAKWVGAWRFNQRYLKPMPFVTGGCYIFDRSAGLGQMHQVRSSIVTTIPPGPRDPFPVETESCNGLAPFFRVVQNPYEVMAYCARPTTRAIGARGGSGWPGKPFVTELNLADGLGFGDSRPDHSGQFSRSIQELRPFYRRAIQECGISAQGSNFEAPARQGVSRLSAEPIVDEPALSVAVNAQTALGGPFGRIRVSNITASDQFGAGGVGSSSDFVSDDPLRLVGYKASSTQLSYFFSEYFHLRQGEVYGITNLTFTQFPPLMPESLNIVCTNRILRIERASQLKVIATFGDGADADVSARVAWTSYRTSNPRIATVSSDGVLLPLSPGVVFVTAVNEGATAVCGFSVIGSGDEISGVQGVALDDSGNPISGAIVRLLGIPAEETKTDAEGRFFIYDVPTTLGPIRGEIRYQVGDRLWYGSFWVDSFQEGMTSVGRIVIRPLFGEGAQKFSAGGSHSLGIRKDGTLWAWGSNSSGQLGEGGSEPVKTLPVGVGNGANWVLAESGVSQSYGLTSDGELWSWGNGELGLDTLGTEWSPKRVEGLRNVARVSAGGRHTMALTHSGELWVWGRNTEGQLGDGTPRSSRRPLRIMTNEVWVAASAGLDFSVALTADGRMFSWGLNAGGQLGNGAMGGLGRIPTRIATNQVWRSVSAGDWHVAALDEDGRLWCWGLNQFGEVGDGTTTRRPAPVSVLPDQRWSSVSARAGYTVALSEDGSLWSCGDNADGNLGDGTTRPRREFTRMGTKTAWVSVSCGRSHVLARDRDGNLWGWGSSRDGRLGNGFDAIRPQPVVTEDNRGWRVVEAGYFHSHAIDLEGRLWSWGYNANGELGNGSTWRFLVPGLLTSPQVWTAISAGGRHTMALDVNGFLWGWGTNEFGQLGTGAHAPALAPVQVAVNKTWTAVSAGSHHTIALDSDGGLMAWGFNGFGALGDGTATERLLPVVVGSGRKWKGISAAGGHSSAIDENGALWSWGYLIGPGRNEYSPVLQAESTVWGSVSAGEFYRLAVSMDGQLWGSGQNRSGQLGDGTLRDREAMAFTAENLRWRQVSAGVGHSLGIASDGSLWSWGDNQWGQLGNGNKENSLVPIRIGERRDWTAVSAGSRHSLALDSDGVVWSWGDNAFSQLGRGYLVRVDGGAVW